MRAFAVAALALVILAGCASPGRPLTGARAELAALQWPQLDVLTTPSEPNEARGVVRIGWHGTLFGVQSATEADLPHRAVVDGETAYISFTGLGWVKANLQAGLADRSLSNRLLLWDLKALAQDPGITITAAHGVEGRSYYNGTGTFVRSGSSMPITVQWIARDGNLVSARLNSSAGREAPFQFEVAATPLAFEVTVPNESKERGEVAQKDALANTAAVQVYHLVKEYADARQGLVPDTVDSQSLQVELVRSSQSWPTNPYSSQPIADRLAHGDFVWTKCGPRDARFAPSGWDSLLFTASFGKGCKV